jgi:nitrite reductase/ring-hydroxylating ferredoxin subunit
MGVTNDETGATTRRGVLLGAGAAGVAVALSACGSSGNSGSGTGTGTGTATGTTVNKADVPVGSGKIVDEVVVTQPTPGDFKAFDAHCTHMNCLVTEIVGGSIHCPCHGSVFSVADGSATGGPAKQLNTGPLAPKAVRVSGDTVTVS